MKWCLEFLAAAVTSAFGMDGLGTGSEAADGTTYMGEWKAGRRCGHGVLQAADGALLRTATDMDMDIATQVECAVGCEDLEVVERRPVAAHAEPGGELVVAAGRPVLAARRLSGVWSQCLARRVQR